MKKKYIKPATTVVLMETETLMAASGENTVTVGRNSIENDYVDAKGHTSLWDFDDDEE